MIDAGQVVIKLVSDTGGYKTGIQGAGSVTDKVMGQMSGAIKAAGAVVSAVIAGQMIGQFTALADQASKFDNLTVSFNNFASAVSGGGPAMMRALKQASGGMIAQTDLMKSYNKAAQLVSRDFAETLPKALPMLQKVAASTGADLNYLLDSFVTGIGRNSKLILDNLGITTNASAANEAYALSIGKKVDALTEEEQQLALTNQVISLLQRNTEGMADISDTVAGRIARIKATWEDMRLGLGVALLPLFESAFAGVETFLGKMVSAIDQVKQGLGIHGGERDPNVVKGMELEGIQVTDETYAKQFSPLSQMVSDLVKTAENVALAVKSIYDNAVLVTTELGNMTGGWETIFDIVSAIATLVDGIATGAGSIALLLGGNKTGAGKNWGGFVGRATAEGTVTGDWIQNQQENDINPIRDWLQNPQLPTINPFEGLVKSGVEGFWNLLGVGIKDTDESLKSFNTTSQQTNTEAVTLGENAGIVSDTFIGMGVGLFGVQNNAGLAAAMLQLMMGPDTTTAVTAGAQMIDESIAGLSTSVPLSFETMYTNMAGQADEIRTMLANKTAGWVSIVKGFVGNFYSTGAALMQGLAQGIINKSKQVIEEVVAAVTAVAEAARKAAGVSSPSRVFMEIGNQLMSGLAIGIDQGSSLAMDSVSAAMGGIIPKTPDMQNFAMVTGIEDMNHKLDQMPTWFREAVQMIT